MFTLVWTARFTRSAGCFVQRHPELRAKFAGVLRDLERDDVEAVSITYDYRIVLTIAVTDKEIILLDIGSHDEVY